MALIVQKFGGSSVATLEHMHRVADIVVKTRQAGHQVLLVCSAMQGETDRLIQLSQQIGSSIISREYDALVSTGEQVTIALLSMILNHRGYPARSYTGGQAGIITDTFHGKARITSINAEGLKTDLQAGCIPVVAGFQGITANGDITTLGRGGSDTTAVAIAAALKADECQIYTDVEGVFTSDPRLIPEAQPLKEVTIEEMLEMASLGSKVLETRAVEFAGKYHVPLRVLSTFNPGEGTLVTENATSLEKPVISSIAFDRNQASFVVKHRNQPDLINQLLILLSEANIELDMIAHYQRSPIEGGDFNFTVARQNHSKVRTLLASVEKQLFIEQVESDLNVAKLSLVGVGIRSNTGVTKQVFGILASEKIPIKLISSSEIKLSLLIEECQLEAAARRLHQALQLHQPLKK